MRAEVRRGGVRGRARLWLTSARRADLDRDRPDPATPPKMEQSSAFDGAIGRRKTPAFS